MAAFDTDLDVDRLTGYLETVVGIEVADVEVMDGGLNVNAVVSTPVAGQAFVVRRRGALGDAYYINDLAQEYTILERLQRVPIPTPEPVAFCDEASVLGAPFFVMTHLDGAVIPLGSDPPARFQTRDARKHLAEELVDTLTTLHGLDTGRFADVCDRRPPATQLDKALGRVEAVTRTTGDAFPKLQSVGDWLQANVPPETETTLVHGDLRPGNVLFGDSDHPEVTGVLDWETAILGDPLVDLGYLLLRWRDADDTPPSLESIEARYPDHDDALADIRETNDLGLAPFTAAPGSPSRQELVERYEARTGRSVENERFYRVLAAFSLATVWADIHREQVSAGQHSEWAPYVSYMALYARHIADGGLPL